MNERCPAIAPKGHDCAGSQCGKYAGHSGAHTALIATEFLAPKPQTTDEASVICAAGIHRVRASRDDATGRWFIPGICPACLGLGAP